GDLAHVLAGLRRRDVLRQRRRRHLERGELVDEPRDAIWIGAFVDAVQTWHPSALKQRRDRLVGGDHQVLDQAVGLRLYARGDRADVALVVERELVLGRFDHERASLRARTRQLRGGDPLRRKRRAPRVERVLVAGEAAVDML